MIKATKDALEKAAIVKALAARVSGLPQNDRRAVLNGAVIFRSLCSNCHGNEGKGIAGVTSVMTAPALQGSKFLKLSQKDNAIRILLNGLSGPVDGKTYASEMPSMAANNNGWIASVLSYVRFEFGDHGGKNNDLIGVRSDEVKKIREENEGRDKPWTEGELMKK
jgi:mono/diheme cytochrome c family protein